MNWGELALWSNEFSFGDSFSAAWSAQRMDKRHFVRSNLEPPDGFDWLSLADYGRAAEGELPIL
jgi:hypothetical protein